MSVIYYGDDKFYRVNESLKNHWRDLAHLFGYPEGWENMGPGNKRNPHIEEFTQLLRNANIEAYNERYEDANETEPQVDLDFKIGGMYRAYPSIFDLIKSLQSINYNMVEAVTFEETKGLLFKIIYHLMDGVIRSMKQCDLSTAWD